MRSPLQLASSMYTTAMVDMFVVALEDFGFVEEGTSAQKYPALEEKAGQMPGDFETGLTRKTFNSVILEIVGSKPLIA
jgi:hypothetical protein